MFRSLSFLIALLFTYANCIALSPEKRYEADPLREQNILRLMTINARHDAGSDKGEKDWSKRVKRIAEMILYYDPDIIGFQELENNQRKDIANRLANYEHFGESRGGWWVCFFPIGEFNCIFYKKKRFEVLDYGTFWLNEEMEPYKKGWGAEDRRICTWGEFFDKNLQKHFWYYNTHLDHISYEARVNGLALVAKMATLQSGGDDLVFIGGDFNDDFLKLNTTVYTQQFVNTRMLSEKKEGPSGTFNDWNKWAFTTIDFILAYFPQNEPMHIPRQVTVLTTDREEKPLSDHFPLFVDIQTIEP